MLSYLACGVIVVGIRFLDKSYRQEFNEIAESYRYEFQVIPFRVAYIGVILIMILAWFPIAVYYLFEG